MKAQILRPVTVLLLVTALALTTRATPVSTSFTFQGQLKQNGVTVNGSRDIEVRLYSSATGQNPVGSPNPNVFTCKQVNNGLVTLELNFGGTSTFNCDGYWLEFRVRPCNSTAGFQILTPRVELLPTPYAIRSLSACQVEANGVTTVSIQDNSVTASKIDSGQVVKSLSGLHDVVNLVEGDNIHINQIGNDLRISALGGPGVWNLNGSTTYYNDGKVGIGTSNPSKRLEVQGPGDVEIGLKSTDVFGQLWTLQSTAASSVFPQLGFPWEGSFQIIDRTVGASRLAILNDGRVGIGTIEPSRNLEVQGVGDVEIGLKSTDAGGRLWTMQSSGNLAGNLGKFQVIDRTLGVSRLSIDSVGTVSWGTSTLHLDQGGAIELGNSFGNGNVPYLDFHFGVGADQDFNVRLINDADRQLTVNGNLNVTGNASVCSLAIRGGCDLAEPFQMSQANIPAGAVVIIDEEYPGQLRMSERAYDNRVAGLVSGANGVKPGISLHQEGVFEGGQNVALSGRVYALADASNGTIKPGDLLTSSSTPGHVMKVTDHTRAQGAIVGKAMSGLKEGKGMVLVLVSLQ